MLNCYHCQTPLRPLRLQCDRCAIEIAGHFELPRLARLAPLHQELAEIILLTGGNLKEVAASLDISYPTLRKRVDELIAALEQLRTRDQARADEFLSAVEKGDMAPEEAARRLGELGGGLGGEMGEGSGREMGGQLSRGMSGGR
jgi:hypothetical protein